MESLTVKDLPSPALRLLQTNGFIEMNLDTGEWFRPKVSTESSKEIMEWWNALAVIGGQPQIRALNPFRVNQFKQLRMRVPNAMELIAQKMETLNDFARSARFITFDFILDSHKLTRLLEGNYSDESRALAAKAQEARVEGQRRFREKEKLAEEEALSPEESSRLARQLLKKVRSIG